MYKRIRICFYFILLFAALGMWASESWPAFFMIFLVAICGVILTHLKNFKESESG